MFGSAILDSATGVIFGFLAISLFTSAIVEVINTGLRLRGRNLKTAIMQLVNDGQFENLALNIYQHALISPFGPGKPPPQGAGNAGADPSGAKTYSAAEIAAQQAQYGKWRVLPSYIDKTQFARAFLDVTGLTDKLSAVTKKVNDAVAAPGGDDPVKTATDALNTEVEKITNPQIKLFLKGVVSRTGGDLSKVEDEIAGWFDASMDRLSGGFKRWTQAATFVIALICAAFLNIDAIHIAEEIWAHPQLVKDLDIGKLTGAAATDPQTELSEVSSLMKQGFPAGWADGHPFALPDPTITKGDPQWKPVASNLGLFWPSLLGWFITAASALFGAPFWFDTLQSVVRLKGSGPSPDEKENQTAAAG